MYCIGLPKGGIIAYVTKEATGFRFTGISSHLFPFPAKHLVTPSTYLFLCVFLSDDLSLENSASILSLKSLTGLHGSRITVVCHFNVSQ